MIQENPRKTAPPERLLRFPEVQSRVGLSKSTIYAAVRQGTFPAPMKLSRRAVCWPASAVEAWIQQRIHPGGAQAGGTNHA